jgi:hypothetical protein
MNGVPLPFVTLKLCRSPSRFRTSFSITLVPLAATRLAHTGTVGLRDARQPVSHILLVFGMDVTESPMSNATTITSVRQGKNRGLRFATSGLLYRVS